MSTPRYTITHESVTVILEGQPYTVKRGDPNFDKARDAVLGKRWAEVPALISKGMKLADWAKGAFTFRDNQMYFQDDALPDQLNTRMLQMASAGDDPTFLMKFWERLQNNPSWRSVQQLYNFLSHQGIAIDQDGFLLAYKGVTRGYRDFHTGTVDNSVGAENSMNRNKISDDPTKGCHYGYHIGALGYAHSFGGNNRVVICRIDPADVVCISNDSSFQKMRVCKYKVIGNHGDQLPDTTFNTEKDDASRDALASGADKFADGLGGRKKDAGGPAQPKRRGKDRDPGERKAGAGAVAQPMAGDEPWRTFGDLSDEELAKQRVWDLRQYAGKILKIVGASKLKKDGDQGLVARIIDVRTTG